jgi:hypothetical protein
MKRSREQKPLAISLTTSDFQECTSCGLARMHQFSGADTCSKVFP